LFADRPDTSTLACYHRNITHASLQTLSLGEFVSWAANEYASGKPLAPAVLKMAKRAASLLSLFSAGKSAVGRKVTYRSASVAAQFKDADWTQAIAVLAKLGD
jgi:hypothetical protein